jgi:hypothetical protein
MFIYLDMTKFLNIPSSREVIVYLGTYVVMWECCIHIYCVHRIFETSNFTILTSLPLLILLQPITGLNII